MTSINRRQATLQAYIQPLENGLASLRIATQRCSAVEVSQWQNIAQAKQEAKSLGIAVILVADRVAS